ncbi:hypothetical protein ACFVTX_18210 [Agromyces sp. NPDC058136]|uniref:hypothetical protein n=1 Tax=Agromyces sp. NPDC058136 TaxID=3346354 RepID=UPI0036DA2342
MNARIFYVVDEHRTPVDELLTKTPLQRFVDLERATREELDGTGLTFADVRDYLVRVMQATTSLSLVETHRDVLLYRAIAWLVLLPHQPEMPYVETASISLNTISNETLGSADEDDAPKAPSEAPVAPQT